MKNLNKVLVFALFFVSFMSLGSKSDATEAISLDDFQDQYCALTFMCGATFTLCSESVDTWPDDYEFIESFLCDVN